MEALRFRKQIRNKKSKQSKNNENAHGSFQGLGKKGRYRPAARDVVTLPLTEMFI
jgi:hypothetical protein